MDVFIPTYNEDLKILEATLVGCIHMRYPHTTYVLDDGHRPEVKALADEFGCKYLSRAENKFAKAGNINEALKKTHGEFIAIFDADTVPQPDFIEKTIGYFNDPATAIVQLPQEFYNLDSMQHHKSLSYWHEQQLFYHVIQPGKNRINATFWCGSPSIVRRKALENIGGVATDCITEDFLTSIRLNANGWKIRYHKDVLAFGIAPQSFYAFTLQRLRWAQGSMKILKSKDNPLIKPGLTIKQRLSHFSAIFTYFDSYQKLIFLLAPAIFLFTGIMPMKVVNGLDFLLHWMPYYVLTTLTNFALGRGFFKLIEVEKYNTLKMVTFIKASFTLFTSKKNIFHVTPKTAGVTENKKDRNEVKVQFIILIVIILSMLTATINMFWNLFLSYSSITNVIAALFWSFFNCYILILALRDVLKRLYSRQDYRFPVDLESSIVADGIEYHARVSDISRTGLRMDQINTESINDWTSINVVLPNGLLNAQGSVMYKKTNENGTMSVGVKFDDLSFEGRNLLNYYLFVLVPRRTYFEGNISPNARIFEETDSYFNARHTLQPKRGRHLKKQGRHSAKRR